MMDDLDLEQLKKELGDTPDGNGGFTVEEILREAKQDRKSAETASPARRQDAPAGEAAPQEEQSDVFARMAENAAGRTDGGQAAEQSLADERMDAFARMIAEEEDEPEQDAAGEPPARRARKKSRVHEVSLEHGANELDDWDEPESAGESETHDAPAADGWEELESEEYDEPDGEDEDWEPERPRGLFARLFGGAEEEEPPAGEPEQDEEPEEESEEESDERPRGGLWSRLFGGAQREQPEEDEEPTAEADETADGEPPAAEPEPEEPEEPEEPDEAADAPRRGFWSRLFRADDAMANDFSDLDDDEPEDEEEAGYDERYDEDDYDDEDEEDEEDEEELRPRGGFLSRLFGRTERGGFDPDEDEDAVGEERPDEPEEREVFGEDEPADDAVTAAFAEPDGDAEEEEEEEEEAAETEAYAPQGHDMEPDTEAPDAGAEEPEAGRTAPAARQQPADTAGSDFWSRLFAADAPGSAGAEQENAQETRVMPELGAEEQRPLTYEELLAQTRVVSPAGEPDGDGEADQAVPDLPEDEPQEPAISEEELQEFLTDARSSGEHGASFEELLRDSGAPETPEQPKKIEFDEFPERETTVYFDIPVPGKGEPEGGEPHRAELFDAEEALEEAEEQRARQEEKRRLIEDSTDDSWIGLPLDRLSEIAPPMEELRREGPVMVREVERQKERIVERRRRYLEKREAEQRARERDEAAPPPASGDETEAEPAGESEESPVFP